MKILVPTKRVVDTDQRICVREDGRDIEDRQLPYVINPFDAIALEEALRLKEQTRDSMEVVVVGVGGGPYEPELRTALAMGADRAIWVRTAMPLDPWIVANVLSAVARREDPALILMGKQAVDDDANQVGQFLAALLGWPQATFASSVELCEGKARVGREVDAGIETVVVQLPAVITTDLRLNEPRYASLPSILRAKQKTIEQIELPELGVEPEPRLRIISMESTTLARGCVMLASVDELVKRLGDVLRCAGTEANGGF
jgi:electron transfer flavoprotein beta subunit